LSFAEPVPPAANQGVSARLVGALDLAGQLASIDHRQLRLRVITIAPGGAMAPHDHKDRPSVEMLVQGKATEFRGGVAKEYKEGDSMVADVATAHWWKNDGDQSAVLVAADIFNPPAK
jgi:quercetin dioxygenase-like cupin family protein